MNCYKRKIFITALIALFLNFNDNNANAAYEVVRATTVKEVGEIVREDDFSPELYNDSEFEKTESNQDLTDLFERKIKKIFKRKNKIDNEDADEVSEDFLVEEETNSEQNLTNKLDFSQEEKQEVAENHKFQINADRVTYDDVDGNVQAQGNVEIIAPSQGVCLKADNAVLNKEEQTLKLNGNVKILKSGTEMRGESLIVDLNEQNILMDNPVFDAFSFTINAQEGFVIANDIQMLNGTLKSNTKKDFPLVSRGFMRLDAAYRNPYFEKMKFDDDNDDSQNRQAYKIDSKEIVITSYKDHNSVLLKGTNVFYNNHKIVRNSDIEIISDKSRQIVETNAPEAGNLRNFGTYIGYGMLYKMPHGHTLKLMPVLAYKESSAGVGLIARYRARHGIVDGGWNTASENLVVRGRYQFSDNVNFAFGRHAYLSEGFMGAMRSGYAAQLQYAKSYTVKDLGVRFNNAFYAGLFSDYEKDNQSEAYSTTRFRYMAQMSKVLKKYKNPEQDFTMFLSAVTQGAATVYGSGETHGIVRIGPQLTTRYKHWDQSIGYLLSGLHGETPFEFDRYRYGKSTITLSEKFNFNEHFALGFRLFITPMKDNVQEDLLTECRFYVIAGPKDAKIAFSYDFVRDVAHMDFMFLIGSENSRINFEKLSTKDIDGKAQKRDFYKHAKPVKIVRPENI